jgi:hypothetical protein
MEETKQKESLYSGEPTKITGPDSLRGTPVPKESSGTQKAATEETQTPPPSAAVAPKISQAGGAGAMEEFAEFLERTKNVWLIAAGAVFGVMAVVTVTTRMAERAKIAREKRQEQAVLDVIPENLIARCGPPTEDVTKEVYPVVLRTMSYQRGENQKIVFEFSRTAEEKSDWVFLSMKDQSGTGRFDTPQAKIAALPCIDSRK